MFSSLACVASEKVTHLSRFFIVTPKEVLHFPFISSEKKKWQSSQILHFILRKKLWKQGFFSYIFVHFFTLQHTDFIPFLMLQDRRFYLFFRVTKPVKISTKMTPFLPIIFTFKKTKNQQFLPPVYPLIISYFPSNFPPVLPLWDALKPLLFLPKILTQTIAILMNLSKILPTFAIKVSKILPT